MNSSENHFTTPPAEEEQNSLVEHSLNSTTESTSAKQLEVNLYQAGQEATNQLDFHLEKPPQPENAFSQMLRQFSGVNPYADRLLATLGHDPHAFPSPEPLTDEERQVEAHIAMMIRDIGQKTIADALQDQHPDNELALAERLRKLPDLMQRGAECVVSEKHDPLSGYFQKIIMNADGTVERYGQQDCERWAKAVLWQAPGIGELPEVSVTEEEQEDLLQGYLAARIALTPQQESDPSQIASLLALLNGSKDESAAPIKKRFSDSLVYVRTHLTNDDSQQSFDESLESVGMSWNEERHQYESSF